MYSRTAKIRILVVLDVLHQFQVGNMLNQSVISEEIQYEGNFVLKKSGKKCKKLSVLKNYLKQSKNLVIIDDFWKEMYDASLNRYVQGPIGAISLVLLLPSFTGIILFIRDRHIKYV